MPYGKCMERAGRRRWSGESLEACDGHHYSSRTSSQPIGIQSAPCTYNTDSMAKWLISYGVRAFHLAAAVTFAFHQLSRCIFCLGWCGSMDKSGGRPAMPKQCAARPGRLRACAAGSWHCNCMPSFRSLPAGSSPRLVVYAKTCPFLTNFCLLRAYGLPQMRYVSSIALLAADAGMYATVL